MNTAKLNLLDQQSVYLDNHNSRLITPVKKNMYIGSQDARSSCNVGGGSVRSLVAKSVQASNRVSRKILERVLPTQSDRLFTAPNHSVTREGARPETTTS